MVISHYRSSRGALSRLRWMLSISAMSLATKSAYLIRRRCRRRALFIGADAARHALASRRRKGCRKWVDDASSKIILYLRQAVNHRRSISEERQSARRLTSRSWCETWSRVSMARMRRDYLTEESTSLCWAKIPATGNEKYTTTIAACSYRYNSLALPAAVTIHRRPSFSGIADEHSGNILKLYQFDAISMMNALRVNVSAALTSGVRCRHFACVS